MEVKYVKAYDGQGNSLRGYSYDAFILLPAGDVDYSIRNVLVSPNNSGDVGPYKRLYI